MCGGRTQLALINTGSGTRLYVCTHICSDIHIYIYIYVHIYILYTYIYVYMFMCLTIEVQIAIKAHFELRK